MFFGIYKPPLEIKKENISIKVEKKDKAFLYKRGKNGERREKFILFDDFEIHINPVEPLNTPQEISPYLFINFSKSLLIGPKKREKIYIKFPIEIAVFIKGKGDVEVIDIFSLIKNKFTLYGDIRSGVVCKYYESEVYKEVPDVNNLLEGVIELTLQNQTKEWVEVNKVVFNAYLMKIYYNENLVSCISKMAIKSKVLAETSFVDKPLQKNMKKSLELFVSRRLPIIPSEFTMEWGL